MSLRNYLLLGLSWVIFQADVAQCLSYTYSDGPRIDIDLSMGYRNDELTTKIKEFNHVDTSAFKDTLKGRNLSLFEVGGKGRGLFGDWLVRGSAYYGWVTHGKYKERLINSSGERIRINGDANQGHTKDGLVGLGYMIPVACNFWIGPVAGWSYDQQHLKVRHTKKNGLLDPLLSGLSYSMQWNGPWIGADMMLQTREVLLSAGYEYHWAHWHGQYKFKEFKNHSKMSLSGKSKDANGYVAYVEGRWNFSDCWNVGLGLKYQYWNASKGRLNQHGQWFDNDNADSFKNTVARVHDAKWTSLAATVDVGFTF